MNDKIELIRVRWRFPTNVNDPPCYMLYTNSTYVLTQAISDVNTLLDEIDRLEKKLDSLGCLI